MTGTGPIVVGVDTSQRARAAALWAVKEASNRSAQLHLVHASAVACPGHPPSSIRQCAGHQLLADVGQECGLEAPGVLRRERLLHALAAEALTTAAQDAQLLVVGDRGAGGASGVVAGSVSTALAGRVRCPLVVVPSPAYSVSEGASVIVGFTPPNSEVSEVAFTFARGWRTGLVAVDGFWSGLEDDFLVSVLDADATFDERADIARGELDRRLQPWRTRYADVPISTAIVHDRPWSAMIHQARLERARLIVSGAVRHPHLDQTAHSLLAHAPCPVATVQTAPDEPRSDTASEH